MEKRNINLVIETTLVVLLLLCLADMPYGFYQLVRFTSACAFAYLSFDYFKANNEKLGFMFAALALLFQPFLKIALGRTLWNVVDVAVAILLIFIVFHAGRKH